MSIGTNLKKLYGEEKEVYLSTLENLLSISSIQDDSIFGQCNFLFTDLSSLIPILRASDYLEVDKETGMPTTSTILGIGNVKKNIKEEFNELRAKISLESDDVNVSNLYGLLAKIIRERIYEFDTELAESLKEEGLNLCEEFAPEFTLLERLRYLEAIDRSSFLVEPKITGQLEVTLLPRIKFGKTKFSNGNKEIGVVKGNLQMTRFDPKIGRFIGYELEILMKENKFEKIFKALKKNEVGFFKSKSGFFELSPKYMKVFKKCLYEDDVQTTYNLISKLKHIVLNRLSYVKINRFYNSVIENSDKSIPNNFFQEFPGTFIMDVSVEEINEKKEISSKIYRFCLSDGASELEAYNHDSELIEVIDLFKKQSIKEEESRLRNLMVHEYIKANYYSRPDVFEEEEEEEEEEGCDTDECSDKERRTKISLKLDQISDPIRIEGRAVELYKSVLETMGLSTNLDKFSIDSRGDSPELREEFGDDYLDNRIIIVSQNQIKDLSLLAGNSAYISDVVFKIPFDLVRTILPHEALVGKINLFYDRKSIIGYFDSEFCDKLNIDYFFAVGLTLDTLNGTVNRINHLNKRIGRITGETVRYMRKEELENILEEIHPLTSQYGTIEPITNLNSTIIVPLDDYELIHTSHKKSELFLFNCGAESFIVYTGEKKKFEDSFMIHRENQSELFNLLVKNGFLEIRLDDLQSKLESLAKECLKKVVPKEDFKEGFHFYKTFRNYRNDPNLKRELENVHWYELRDLCYRNEGFDSLSLELKKNFAFPRDDSVRKFLRLMNYEV